MFTAHHRWIPLLAAVVLLAACGSYAPASAPASAAASTNPTAPSGAVRVSLLDYSISPATISVPAGASTFYVTNDGKTPHNFVIRTPGGRNGKIVGHSKDLNPGQADLMTATLPAGDYTFFCAFPGHEQLGMAGTLTAK